MKSCEYCGKETANPKFCSLSCSSKAQPRTSKYPYYKECVECKRDFKVTCSTESIKTFCSKSCSASHNNRKQPKRKSSREKKPCLHCGSITTNPKFCSQICGFQYAKDKRVENIENGGDVSCGNPTERNYLLSLQGGLCAICKCLPMHNGLELKFILDHIDGNSEHNKKENLRFVCPNCDSQLPTYKAKNRGNGRHARRVRYAEGKSY